MKERTLCREEMRRDLMRVYGEVYRNLPMGTTQTEVYELVVQQPARRFYVDPRRAHLIISGMTRGDMSGLRQLSPLKQQMYRDLYEKVMEMSQRKGFWGKRLFFILREAVLEPAPRFYISAKRMEQIWKEKTYENRQQRYRRTGKPYEKTDD